MKKIFIITVVIFTSYFTNAQHFPKLSQYELNKNLINPAAVINDNINVNTFYRNQWTGMNVAPKTLGINAYGKFNKMSFGLFILNDKAGVFNQNVIHLSYSYALAVSDDINLQFGLSGGIDMYKIKYSSLNMYHENDPMLFAQDKSSILPDANFGVLLSNVQEDSQWAFGSLKRKDPLFYVGISVQHLLGVITKSEVTKNNSYLSRHFNLMGGIKHPLGGGNFQMEETILLKYVKDAPFQADIGFRIFYNNAFWAGLAYRTLNDVVVKVGVAYKYILLGYSYDISFHKIPNFSTHEIVLGFRMSAMKFVPKY